MAAFNGFPATYQPFYYNPYQSITQQPQTPVQAPQTATGGVIWVQGEAGAKSYLVAPNTTVQLWDSERQTIYLKSADASGMPTLKTLDYTIRDAAPAAAPTAASVDYATRADLEALAAQIKTLKTELDRVSKEGKASE